LDDAKEGPKNANHHSGKEGEIQRDQNRGQYCRGKREEHQYQPDYDGTKNGEDGGFGAGAQAHMLSVAVTGEVPKHAGHANGCQYSETKHEKDSGPEIKGRHEPEQQCRDYTGNQADQHFQAQATAGTARRIAHKISSLYKDEYDKELCHVTI